MALSDLLLESTLSLNYDGKDANDVISHLGQKLYQAGLVKESFVEAALLRESTLPTGLPLGGSYNAAIPHTDIFHVKAPGVAMATLIHPVIFQNMVRPSEDVEVKIVFLLALEQPKSQIDMLQEIACVLQDPDLIEKLIAAKKPEEVFSYLANIGQ